MSRTLMGRISLVMSLFLVLVLVAGSAMADSAPPPDSSGEVDDLAEDTLDTEGAPEGTTSAQAGSGDAGTSSSRLSVHGFMTQAWAEADFADPPTIPPFAIPPVAASPTGTEASFGIPEDGTTDYRFLALQFRYDISPKDVFVVQLSSRALGFSATTDAEDEIELDWAFYERRLTDNTSIKVGRVQIPMGIFNEIRDVGTVLPFYRPPFNFYREGAFTSETVDGLLISHEFLADSDWGLELSAYAGEWELISLDPFDPTRPAVARARDGYGYQVWLSTPIQDLRFGTGLNSYVGEGEGLNSLERTDILFASVEGLFGPFTIRAEFQEVDLVFPGPPSPPFPPAAEFDLTSVAWYVQAGYQVTEKLSIWAQREKDTIDADCICFLDDPGADDLFPEWAFSLNYAFSPGIVLKAEYHITEAFADYNLVDFSTGVGLLVNFDVPYEDGSYSILSLSVSF